MRFLCRSILPAVLLASGVCHAQGPTPPSAAQLRYLRFILLNVASLDHDPNAIKAFEDNLVKQFGLSAVESAAIHSAGQSLKPVLAQNRQAAVSVCPSSHFGL